MATSFCKNIHCVFYLFILLLPFCWSRNHRILLQDEVRQTVELSKFGFLQNGILSVNFTDMVVQGKGQVIFGFSLEKTGSDGISPYMEQHSEKCIFMDHSFDNANQISLALINLDLRSKSIKINKYGKDFLNLTIDSTPALPELATSTAASSSSDLNPAGNAPTAPAETSSSSSSSSNVFKSTSSTASSSTATKSSSVSTSSSTTPKTTASSSSANAGESNSVTSSSSPATKSSTSTASSSPVPKTSASESSLSNAAGERNSALPSSAAESGSISASSTTKQSTSTVSTTSSNQAASATVATAANNPESNESSHRRRRNADTEPVTLAKGEEKSLPLYSKKTNISNFKYSGNFVVKVKSKAEEGLYNLYFHNCPLPNAQSAPSVPVAIQIDIVEKNEDNYLSAGEEPLPLMFGVLSVIFFVTAVYWFRVLRRNREFTYKVHYMMFVLILLKSLDLMFQAVNFHFISKDGKPAESWEVLYYITHLLKGALLFTTIVLIGTGYFFVKHVLSDRDKKIFMIVIPLQILANTAQIVMESTEEASKQYTTWKELFILVDLLCCGAILFPVVWSIRHLQEGSQTDGKAALNLAKLKLFRHFYVMIVCYIYFTRIIVYLIKITVPFQYMWLDDFFNNAASFVFFVLTGYKFRPAPDNPYLHVPDEDTDDEVEMDEVVTNSGFTDGVTRLQPSSNGKRIFETA